MKSIRLATLDPEPVAMRDGAAIHIEMWPMEIGPFDVNRVKVTLGGVSRVVDGVALADACNRLLGVYRSRRS